MQKYRRVKEKRIPIFARIPNLVYTIPLDITHFRLPYQPEMQIFKTLMELTYGKNLIKRFL